MFVKFLICKNKQCLLTFKKKCISLLYFVSLQIHTHSNKTQNKSAREKMAAISLFFNNFFFINCTFTILKWTKKSHKKKTWLKSLRMSVKILFCLLKHMFFSKLQIKHHLCKLNNILWSLASFLNSKILLIFLHLCYFFILYKKKIRQKKY